MSLLNRPKLLKTIQAGIIKSQLDIEYESKVEELKRTNGLLIINGQKYPVKVDDFEYLAYLGNGSCGHVTKMKHKPSGVVMAVKRKHKCTKCNVHEYQYKKMIIDLPVDLKTNECPHIVQCFGYFFNGTIWIFMELMETSLDKLLKNNKQIIPEYILGKVTVATVKALSYLEEKHGIHHKNVKPRNIFLDDKGEVKLSDFRIPDRSVDKINTDDYTLYAAPEKILSPEISKLENYIRANVWSIGITLLELASGIFPYTNCKTIIEVMKAILKETPSISPTARFSPEFRDFIDYCLVKDHQQRPGYSQLIEHPFFQKYDKFNRRTLSILALNGLTKLCHDWNQALTSWEQTNKNKSTY